jgi:tetrahydromethanopterin S-methyltransferase subunit F
MKNDFSPAEIISRAFRLWWVVVVAAIIGGGIGFLIHHFLPPVFSSQAEITTSINFAKTGVLSDEKQDQAINAAGDVILSSDVEVAVLSQAASQGITLDGKAFEKMRFSDRMGYRWIFGIQSVDAKLAADLANIWGEISLNYLNKSLNHALIADNLSATLQNLESCLQEVSVVAPSYSVCQQMDIGEIQTSIEQISAKIISETAASSGMLPSMSIAWTKKAEQASSPSYRNRNLMVFSGLVIGFILGIMLVQIPFNFKKPSIK